MATYSTEAIGAHAEEASEHKSNFIKTDAVVLDDQESEQRSEASILVVCPCRTDTRDELMFVCKYCLKLQHGACYRVVNSDDILFIYLLAD